MNSLWMSLARPELALNRQPNNVDHRAARPCVLMVPPAPPRGAGRPQIRPKLRTRQRDGVGNHRKTIGKPWENHMKMVV